MPRLSVYKPEKGNDYRFIDKNIWEMFQVGGTDVLLHRYLGPGESTAGASPSTPVYDSTNPFQIQDLLFLENRDRKYDPDIYQLRGIYNLSDIDFNLSQFGLFLQNDTIFITFHINDTIEKLGRKMIAGDVLELPHLKDDHALNELSYALKRFFVIEEVSRAAEGFSITWYPHLYRAKCKPLVDSQEFKQILDGVANSDSDKGIFNTDITYYPGDIVAGEDGKTYEVVQEVTGIAPPNGTYYQLADSLRDIISTYNQEMQITKAVLDQATADAPRSGYDNSNFWTLQRDENGRAELVTVDNSLINQYSVDNQRQATDSTGSLLFDENNDPIYVGITASSMLKDASNKGYIGYLTADGIPPNGTPLTAGIAFPINPVDSQYCLRTDYLPNRLFRYNGVRWIKIEDNVRMTMNNLGSSDTTTNARYPGYDVRKTQKATFINNPTVTSIDGHTVKEKQSLSRALRPQADE
jgi:hypothetical protein